MNYAKTRTTRILQALSQLGHAISGGSSDISISGRIGYMCQWKNLSDIEYWKKLEQKINKAFDPIDGAHHCYRAYLADKEEDYRIGMDDPKFKKRLKRFVSIFVPIIKIAVWFLNRKKGVISLYLKACQNQNVIILYLTDLWQE